MLNKELIIKRLSLIKYLYKQGIEQSYQTETISAFSILNLHDSIEMFLKLLSEHKNIKSDKFSFIEYWNKIEGLTLKESMNNLNARRVNIKHKGLLPSKSDIEISRVNATDFFQQNCIKFFNINFEEISLLNLISYENIRKYLEISQDKLDKGDFEKSIENSSIAFENLFIEYENSKSFKNENSPFDFKNYSFIFNHNPSETGYFQKFENAIRILSFGIDYKKYSKFKILISKKRIFDPWQKKLNINNCQFCIDFVLYCSLKLQEFDFDIDELLIES